MANPTEWGPLVWKILHVISTKLGTQTYKLLQNDEIQYYNNFTKHIGYVLPCKLCRKHYYDYALKNKKNIEYYDLREYSINYYFNLHNEVNAQKNKNQFTKEEFLVTYSNIKLSEFNSYIHKLNTLFESYILYHYISPEALRNFNISLTKLRNIIRF